jgi:xanthine dehydrogenase YagS FAD-binding subunit
MAFNATVEIAGPNGKKRSVTMEEFFVDPETDSRTENILASNELITGVTMPAVNENIKSFYIKQGARESHDWAIADVAVVMEMSGGRCENAEVVLGAAAPVPVKSEDAVKKLKGKSINESVASSAGKASVKGATPLANNAYKVPIFRSIVERAILKAV